MLPGGVLDDDQTLLIYDALTGMVGVDGRAAVELTSIHIASAAGFLTGYAAHNLGGSFDFDSDPQLLKATFGSSFGSLSFGTIAQPGLSEDFLLADLSLDGSLALVAMGLARLGH